MNLLASIRLVFSKPWYVVLGLLVAFCLVVINSLLPQRELIATIIASDSFDWIERVRIIGNLLLTFGINVTVIGKILSIVVALAAGISVAMLVYYLRLRLKVGMAGGASLIGILISFIGVGCASCGSVILASVVGLSAATAFISFLPLSGLEFGLASLILLGWSIYSTGTKMQKAVVCKTSRQYTK